MPGNVLNHRLKAATLAIGTEVTDGQILDRNSALLSKKISNFGFDVVEHRAVPDDRGLITRALRELTQNPDPPLHVLFVTGGLGPTSDDFTREVLAEFFQRALNYDAPSWAQIEERLTARGIAPREIQKQQCYFPQGSQILFNPAGTANGFMFGGATEEHRTGVCQRTRVIALPGPPAEIEAIWRHSLKDILQDLVPPESRDELLVWQCLGRGESEIAELVEPALKGSGLRLGYRVHLPYVEVKVWAPLAVAERRAAQPYLDTLKTALRPWTVAEGASDAAIDFMKSSRAKNLCVLDLATQGLLANRLTCAIADTELVAPENFEIRTLWQIGKSAAAPADGRATFKIETDVQAQRWYLSWHPGDQGPSHQHSLVPTHRFKVESQRGRTYVTEMALLWANSLKS